MPTTSLRLESLDDRSLMSFTPASSLWPDASALSLSFAPDGTASGTGPSALFKTLNKTTLAPNWQREVLRAFQTWAVNSNINVAVTKDNGSALGVSGDTQGDTRFGDIRVGAAPLAADSLANASPYDWSIGTWSGDVLLNTQSKFAINPAAGSATADLFSVMLHEAGHVFGLDHSGEPGSAMAARFGGTSLGPAADDILALQANYGPRSPDNYEGANGNDRLATAFPLTVGSTSQSVTGDVGSRTDADFFKVSMPNVGLLNPLGLLSSVEVRVRTAGISSLAPSLTVYDAAGRQVAVRTATDPLNPTDLTYTWNRLSGQTFYVKVAGATNDVFSIGRYQLQLNNVKLPTLSLLAFGRDGGVDDTIVTAVDLPRVRPQAELYAVNAAIESATDVDAYRLTAPATGTADTLTVQVRNLSSTAKSGSLSVTVTDAAGVVQPAWAVASEDNRLVVQVSGVRSGAAYFVRVAGGSGPSNYRLTAAFGKASEPDMDLVQSVALTANDRQAAGALTVDNGRLFQFEIGSVADTVGTVRLTVTDASGAALFTLDQSANQVSRNGQVYLPAGTYRVTVTRTSGSGELEFWLLCGVFSDPIGPYQPGATGTPSTTTTGGTSTTTGTPSTTTTGGTSTTTGTPSTTTSQTTKNSGYRYTTLSTAPTGGYAYTSY